MILFDELQNCADERAKESVGFYLREAENTGLSFYAAVASDCLLVIGKDEDGVVFFPPEPLDDDADVSAALDAVDEFAGAACTERVFVGLDAEWEDYFALRYRDHEITDMGDGFSGFRVVTELHRLKTVEPIKGEHVTLTLPNDADAALFDMLKKETAGSLYGYETNAGDLLAEIGEEWEKRAALSLVIRNEEKPVGEVTLYSFDGRKTAKIAVRVLSAFRRSGYAKEAIREAVAFCRGTLRLEKLRADVAAENAPSLSLFASLFIREGEKDGIVSFYRNL